MKCLQAVCPVLVVLIASAAGAQPAGSGAAGEELLKRDKEWAQAAATRDLEQIVSYWTDDAVVYMPGDPPVAGKEAIRKYVGDSLNVPGFSITWAPTRVEVSKSGDLGYTTGTNTVTFPGPQGGTTTVQGRYATVWRKEKDGKWRCVIDTWNPGPTAPPK